MANHTWTHYDTPADEGVRFDCTCGFSHKEFKTGEFGNAPFSKGVLVMNEHFENEHPEEKDTSVIAAIASPDAPTVTNEQGGSQSDIPVRFDLIDAKAMFEMAKVLDEGARKYGADNWRKIPINDHLNHLLMHTFAYLSGDKTDDHLSHILCRATFAMGVKCDERDS